MAESAEDISNENKDQSSEENEKYSIEEHLVKEETPNEENAETGEGAEGAVEKTDEAEDITEDLKEEIKELTSTLQRERAEFINFRRRTQAEKDEAHNKAVKTILAEMIPAMDAFDQLFALEVKEEQKIDQFMDGVKLIRKQLWQSFSKFGVEELDPAGKDFDPNTMEALSAQESDEVSSETVGQVYQKGYTMAGQVLRPARVGVNKPSQKSEE